MITSTPETDTPETDAAIVVYYDNGQAFETLEPDFSRKLERQRNNTLALLEREQMRLAACDVIAMCDTPASAAEARQMHSDYESAALDSVKRRVDECIALRQMVRELRDAVTIGIKSQNKGDIWSVQPSKFAKFKEDAVAALTKANQLLP